MSKRRIALSDFALPSLALGVLGFILTLSAAVAQTDTPAETAIVNQAEARYLGPDGSPRLVRSNQVVTIVQAVCRVSVLPNGTVAAPAQTLTGLPGGTVVLPYVLTNTGNATSSYALASELLAESDLESVIVPESIAIVWDQNGNGQVDEGEPVVTTLTDVAAGESAALLVVVTLPGTATGELYVNLAASCADTPTVRDDDNVSRITVLPATISSIQKQAEPAGQLYPGATVRYTISFTAGAAPLQEVVVSDVLDTSLEDPSAFTDGLITDPKTGLSTTVSASYQNRTLNWRIASVPAGMTVRLVLTSTVGSSAADTVIANTACVSAAGLTSPCSETVRQTVAPLELALTKTTSNARATVGDTVRYTLTASNSSSTVPLDDLLLRDTLPEGLAYLPGSAVLTPAEGDEVVLPPEQADNTLVWQLPPLAPQAQHALTFEARVTVAALGGAALVNTAVLSARSSTGEAIATQDAAVTTEVDPGVFRARSVLMGVAFIDEDDSGIFDPGIDTPVEGLRLYLSNGLSIVTDEFGRYTFQDLPPGTLALRTDPVTLPEMPLKETATEDGPGLWQVQLYPGLISKQDIPFAPSPRPARDEPD